MFYNHLFWTTLTLLFCSAINIKVYFDFSGTNKTLRNSIGLLGLFGAIAAHINLIILSLEFNWWWFVAGIGCFLLSVGIISFLFRTKNILYLGVLNFLLIPLFWIYGSQFNTLLSTDWFCYIADSIQSFFA